MSNDRPGVKFDLDDAMSAVAAVPKPAQIDKTTAKAATADAKAVGFGSRAGAAKIDRRTLRKKLSPLTSQLAMKVTPETRESFAIAAADYPNSNDFIEHLLDLHRKYKVKS